MHATEPAAAVPQFRRYRAVVGPFTPETARDVEVETLVGRSGRVDGSYTVGRR